MGSQIGSLQSLCLPSQRDKKFLKAHTTTEELHIWDNFSNNSFALKRPGHIFKNCQLGQEKKDKARTFENESIVRCSDIVIEDP